MGVEKIIEEVFFMTNGEVDRLGNNIRLQGKNIDDYTLQQLQKYRTSHEDSLSKVFNILCSLSKRVNKGTIVTYRIKRIESIVDKLSRYPEMRFNRMWDIAGCRCIITTDDQLNKFKRLIEKHPLLEVRKINDYLITPQKEGYRALHIFVNIKNSSTVIEIQLRNQVDHNWATLVEITDLLYDVKLKEYGNHKDLLRFHELLSRIDELDIVGKKEIARIIGDYKYFEKLNLVFSKNYIQVRKQWLDIEGMNGHKFFLIETKKDDIPRILSYRTFFSGRSSIY